MDNIFLAFCIGAVFGLCLAGAIVDMRPPKSPLKAECELTLPRNQNCVQQWVPAPPQQKESQ